METRMRIKPVQWWEWPVDKKGGVLPVKGIDKQTGKAVIGFPTVIVTGRDLHSLPPLSMPVQVIAGFQSARKISSVEVTLSGDPNLSLHIGADRSFVLALPNNLVDAAAGVECLRQGLSMIAAQNRSALTTLIRSSAHALNNYAIAIIGSFEIMGINSPDAEKALQSTDWNLTYDQNRNFFNMAREEKIGIDNRVEIALAGIQQLKSWFDKVEQILGALTSFKDDKLTEDINRARQAVEEAMPLMRRTLNVLNDLGQLSVLRPTSLKDPIFLQQLIKDLLPGREDVLDCKILGNSILLCEIFEEMVSNAKRATGKDTLEDIRLEIDAIEESGEIRITLINKVNNQEMRGLAEQRDQLFDLAVDPFDGFKKPRIFHQGVSSRSGGGGTGLAVVWERVVLNFQGRIEADYHPKQNEFSLAVYLRLSQ
jgi:hypothetical protein